MRNKKHNSDSRIQMFSSAFRYVEICGVPLRWLVLCDVGYFLISFSIWSLSKTAGLNSANNLRTVGPPMAQLPWTPLFCLLLLVQRFLCCYLLFFPFRNQMKMHLVFPHFHFLLKKILNLQFTHESYRKMRLSTTFLYIYTCHMYIHDTNLTMDDLSGDGPSMWHI